MEKYRGKTLEEWRTFIKEDKQIGIRTTKYIIVLEELVAELQSKLHQPTVISCPCDGGIIVCPGCNGEQSKFGICAGCHGEGKVVCGKCGGKNNKSI